MQLNITSVRKQERKEGTGRRRDGWRGEGIEREAKRKGERGRKMEREREGGMAGVRKADREGGREGGREVARSEDGWTDRQTQAGRRRLHYAVDCTSFVAVICTRCLFLQCHIFFVEISGSPAAPLPQKEGGSSSTTTIGIFVAYIFGITPS